MFLGGTNTKFSKISAKELASFFHTLITEDLRPHHLRTHEGRFHEFPARQNCISQIIHQRLT